MISFCFFMLNGAMRLYESTILKEYTFLPFYISSLFMIATLQYGSHEGFFPLKAYKYLTITYSTLFFLMLNLSYGLYNERKNELMLFKDIKNRNDSLEILL